MINPRPYIGRPYTERGCWTLLRVVYAEQLSVLLPDYVPPPSDAPTAQRAAFARMISQGLAELGSPWIPIAPADARESDGILFRIGGADVHVGVVLDGKRFLHARPGAAACVESYASPRWAGRIAGVYRHRALA